MPLHLSSVFGCKDINNLFDYKTLKKKKYELTVRYSYLYAAIQKKITTMAHRLNTNKQFMVGNGILAFAVIFVVVIFVYMSMRLQQKQQEERHFIESYTISLVKKVLPEILSLYLSTTVSFPIRLS